MLDLFGEVVVTWDDIEIWVSAVAPAFMSSQRAFDTYVRGWNVAEKVRHAKLSGTFEHTIEKARHDRAALLRRLGLTS